MTDWDSLKAGLGALGLSLANVVAGGITAFVALRFFDGLMLWEKWATFMGGWALAAFGASPLAQYFELREKLEVGVALLLGLFGMSLAAAIINMIKETDWPGLLRSIIDVLLRRQNGGPK